MTNRGKNHQATVCPFCGQPVTFGFLRFKISDKVKILLAVLVIGYAILSISILAMVLPPELRKYCNHYDYQHQPDYCKDNEFTLSVQSLNKELALQIFVGGGLAIGVLIFYWDWLQNMYENWQRKRGKLVQKHEEMYKYKCRHCGWQWN
jgi:hypothetical protein